MKHLLLAFALNWSVCLFINRAYAQSKQNTITIRFHHTVDQQELSFDSTYTNSHGEAFTIHKFRYYVSGIQLEDATSKKSYYARNDYFLINEINPGSKTISLTVPAGHYRSFSFLIGVDSVRNVSGAQTGALDPLNDMFWTWRSGYVMAKLEGRSKASSLPRYMFEYHIGGFSGVYNVLQRVSFDFPTVIEVGRGKNPVVDIKVNINRWFDGIHPLPIAQFPSCTVPGELAKKYAGNYGNMFTVQSVQP